MYRLRFEPGTSRMKSTLSNLFCDPYINLVQPRLLFYFPHFHDAFLKYRRISFILLPSSHSSPSLSHAFSFLRANTEEEKKSYAGRYKVQDFTSPWGNRTTSILLVLSFVCTVYANLPISRSYSYFVPSCSLL